jgi:endonuclease YncB( thermonuclease family)
MPKGLLRVTGTLDPSQFWPNGNSDADTINVQVGANSFEFSRDSTPAHFTVTKVFQDASVRGKGPKPKPVIHNGKVTVRLQGVDAPELHFPPLLQGKGLQGNNHQYRQFFGETASIDLAKFLRTFGAQTIQCEVVTRVDKPNDVFDTYGRLVGDILIGAGRKDVNLWLARNGWAFPTYYNSMMSDEIRAIRKAANAAKKANKGIWAHFSLNTAEANLAMMIRKGSPNPQADVGPVQLPKLYRRKIRHLVGRLNGMFPATFDGYLKTLSDPWVNVTQFLKDPQIKATAQQRTLAPLVDSDGLFAKQPGVLVFFEAPSKLRYSNGKPVTGW